jgi:hypothetical protein
MFITAGTTCKATIHTYSSSCQPRLQDTCLVDCDQASSSLYASRWLGAGAVNCFHGFLIRNKMFPALVNTNRTSAIRQTMANASFFRLAIASFNVTTAATCVTYHPSKPSEPNLNSTNLGLRQ